MLSPDQVRAEAAPYLRPQPIEPPDDDVPDPVAYPESADGERDDEPDQGPTQQPQPLQWLDMSNWDSAPVPQRKWAIRDRVPLNQAGLFSGEGGTGKSIIELMKDATLRLRRRPRLIRQSW